MWVAVEMDDGTEILDLDNDVLKPHQPLIITYVGYSVAVTFSLFSIRYICIVLY